MAEDQERERLGTTFDLAAELYQDARPDYPEVLFDRLLQLTEMRPGDRVLEVGAGPGKATLPLLRRGLRVTAIEPGAALAGAPAPTSPGTPRRSSRCGLRTGPVRGAGPERAESQSGEQPKAGRLGPAPRVRQQHDAGLTSGREPPRRTGT